MLQLEVLQKCKSPMEISWNGQDPWHHQLSLVVSFLCLVPTPHLYILLTIYSLLGLSSYRQFVLWVFTGEGDSSSRSTVP